MKQCALFVTLMACLNATPAARASDACSTTSIRTAADVTVSDGSSFQTESWFHTRNGAAIRHIAESDQVVAAEGPLAWVRRDGEAELAAEALGRFALGHQFHALFLHFADIVDGEPSETALEFHGRTHRAWIGNFPFGGRATLVSGDDARRPAGLLIDEPDVGRITVYYDEWQARGDIDVPYLVRIDDGDRVFDYRYTRIDLTPDSPLWFFDAVPAPPLDDLRIYRLHRQLLAAHCLGDADLMADNSAPQSVMASRGRLIEVSRETTRSRFTRAFERWNYTGYVDLVPPVIRVSSSGDLGWIGVNVRATGRGVGSEDAFDDEWAWFMTVGKFNGRWLNTGNASNIVE